MRQDNSVALAFAGLEINRGADLSSQADRDSRGTRIGHPRLGGASAASQLEAE